MVDILWTNLAGGPLPVALCQWPFANDVSRLQLLAGCSLLTRALRRSRKQQIEPLSAPVADDGRRVASGLE
jgi:hypothetical protein